MTGPHRDDRPGDADVRVVWAPGSSGDLVGTCRCGARFTSPDPEAVWNWYAAHDPAAVRAAPRRGNRDI